MNDAEIRARVQLLIQGKTCPLCRIRPLVVADPLPDPRRNARPGAKLGVATCTECDYDMLFYTLVRA